MLRRRGRLLERLRQRTHGAVTRPVGCTALLDADRPPPGRPSSRTGRWLRPGLGERADRGSAVTMPPVPVSAARPGTGRWRDGIGR
jgi:hypothetical protein